MTNLDDMAIIWKANTPPTISSPKQSIIDIFDYDQIIFGAVQWDLTKRAYVFFPVFRIREGEYTYVDLHQGAREFYELKRYLGTIGIRHMKHVFKSEKFGITKHQQLPKSLKPTILEIANGSIRPCKACLNRQLAVRSK